MSKEMLSRKLIGGQNLAAEPSTTIETNKDKRGTSQIGFLLVVVLGAVALISFTLLVPITSNYKNESNSADDSSSHSAAMPADMASFITAKDGNGAAIEDNGLTKSAQAVIEGYADSSYSTALRCSINSFPTYCNGSPVALSGLPPGQHVFTVVERLNDEITAQSFNWEISD
jgi:hypothetical protein